MTSYNPKNGNILISMALAGGILLFMAAFINAGMRAIRPTGEGSVQGAFIAQRTTFTPVPSFAPSAVPTAIVSARSTLTPLPSPYIHVMIKDQNNAPVAFTGGTVCSGTFGGQIITGAISTSNCIASPTSDFKIPVDQYKGFGKYTGVFVRLPGGWGTPTASPLSGLVQGAFEDERSNVGFGYGWDQAGFSTGFHDLTLQMKTPPSYGYIVIGSTVSRITYYPNQSASIACSDQVTISTCANSSLVVKGTATGTQCTVGGTAWPIYSNGYCATPSSAPVSSTPTSAATSPKPTCAIDCSLQPKGDATCDLVVDSADYTYWFLRYTNKPIPPSLDKPTIKGPDFNGDGKINLRDLQIWQDGLYTPPPTPAGACAAPATDVHVTPTLGPGCRYQTVQCVKAPCDPIVICPTPTSCPVKDCAAPPAGCSYQGGNSCSCGSLVCANSTVTTTPKVSPSPTGVVSSSANGCDRVYSADGPWNTPIAANPTLETSVSIDTLTNYGGTLGSDPGQYTVPVYPIDATTPLSSFNVSGKYSNVSTPTTTTGEKGIISLRIPDNAVQSTGGDAEIVMWNQATGDEYGFWKSFKNSDGTWSATNGYHYNTNWTGAPPIGFGSRGSGTPYMSGLIRKCEIQQGHIDHALALVIPHSACDKFVAPATKTDGDGLSGDIPEGARLQLDPSLTDAQIQAFGCTGTCLIIAHAMQKYGMINTDIGGHAKLYVEDEHSAHWNGLITANTVSSIPYTKMRVLGFGTVTSNGKQCQ